MPDSPERTELKTWFKKIWRDTPGAVKLAFQVEKDLVWSNVMFTWPNQLDAIVEWVLAKVGQGADVFYAPAIFKDRTSGRSENVLGSWTLWTDFDGNAPENWTGGAFDKLPEPSVRIQSSTADRQHCYWFLDEFISREILEPKNRALAYELGADTSGWDAGQVLRPPATKNYGHAKPDRKLSYPVEVIEERGTLFGPSFIETPTYFVDIVKNAVDLTNLPSLALVLAKGKWSEDFTETYFLPKAPYKKRSDALMWVGYCGAEAGLTDSEIYVLVEDADTRWGKYTTRTPDRRFALLCDIVERARFKHPVGSDVDFLANFGKPKAALQVVYTNREFRELKVPEQTFIFDNLLTEHGMGMLGGEPGVGKTQLSNALGTAAATGSNFLVWKCASGPQRTLLLNLEMPLRGNKKFIDLSHSSLSKEKMELADEYLLHAPLSRALPLDTDSGRKFLVDLTKNYKPQLIVIDSLAKSTSKNLNEDVPARQLNDWLQEFRSVFGVTVVIIHHTRKGVTGGKKATDLNVLDELLGNRFISQDLDFVLGCYKIPKQKGRLYVRNAKNRYAEEHPDITISRQPDLTFKVDQIHDGEDSDTGETLLGDFLKGLKKDDD